MLTKGSNCFWFWHFDACFLSAPSCQTAFHHPFPYFTTFWRDSPLVSIQRHPASSPTHLDIPPSLLSSMSFLPKVCTLHSVSPLHLAATTSKVRGVFNVVSVFFFFGGFVYMFWASGGLLDCYDDLTYKCFGQKIFLKINFLERFLVACIRFQQALKSISRLI